MLFQSNFRKGGKFKRENKRNVLKINHLLLDRYLLAQARELGLHTILQKYQPMGG